MVYVRELRTRARTKPGSSKSPRFHSAGWQLFKASKTCSDYYTFREDTYAFRDCYESEFHDTCQQTEEVFCAPPSPPTLPPPPPDGPGLPPAPPSPPHAPGYVNKKGLLGTDAVPDNAYAQFDGKVSWLCAAASNLRAPGFERAASTPHSSAALRRQVQLQ